MKIQKNIYKLYDVSLITYTIIHKYGKYLNKSGIYNAVISFCMNEVAYNYRLVKQDP